jgi:drug/metabolite transporter (DMT)-like permease
MIVFPLKWAPLIFVIGGFLVLVSEGDLGWLIVIAIGVVLGGVLHYFVFYNKQGTRAQKQK